MGFPIHIGHILLHGLPTPPPLRSPTLSEDEQGFIDVETPILTRTLRKSKLWTCEDRYASTDEAEHNWLRDAADANRSRMQKRNLNFSILKKLNFGCNLGALCIFGLDIYFA